AMSTRQDLQDYLQEIDRGYQTQCKGRHFTIISTAEKVHGKYHDVVLDKCRDQERIRIGREEIALADRQADRGLKALIGDIVKVVGEEQRDVLKELIGRDASNRGIVNTINPYR